MTVSHELLWKAYPDGYLAMRGVTTVGGWICLGKDFYWVAPPGADVGNRDEHRHSYRCVLQSSLTFDRAEPGDLLPNVDPTDHATWACLLADLIEAAGLPSEQNGVAWRPVWKWTSDYPTDKVLVHWQLLVWLDGDEAVRTFRDITTRDPALALVLARIQLRETIP